MGIKRAVFIDITTISCNNSYIENVSFKDSVQNDIIFDCTNFVSVEFNKSSLKNSSFSDITFRNLEFNDCDLSFANFSNTLMSGLDLRSCNISGIITYAKDIKGVILTSEQSLAFIKLLGITIID